MVIWIIGLSGSGKTFLAKKLESILKKKTKIIIVDGDEVREKITYKFGYDIQGRKKNSRLISDLCNYLEFKGYCVICPILSIFRSHQKKNRRLFKKYIQVYIKSSIEELKKRNNKLIYKKKNVVVKSIKFPEPYKSDIIVKNDFTKNFKKEIKKIVTIINKK